MQNDDRIEQISVFTGYASVFNNIDQQGDVMLPGAFRECKAQDVKLLWQHRIDEPIGRIVSMEEDNLGLFIKASLFLTVPKGREAYFLVKGGAIQGLSIGYSVIQAGKINSARALQRVKLWEISLVTFPCNVRARIINIRKH